MKSKARQELDKDRDEIFRIFGYKCILCGRPTKSIHEILPTSHGRVALSINNRVPLCDFPWENNHHDWAHRVGTNVSIPILQAKREEYLTRYQNLVRTEQEYKEQFLGKWDEQDLQKESQNRESISG